MENRFNITNSTFNLTDDKTFFYVLINIYLHHPHWTRLQVILVIKTAWIFLSPKAINLTLTLCKFHYPNHNLGRLQLFNAYCTVPKLAPRSTKLVLPLTLETKHFFWDSNNQHLSIYLIYPILLVRLTRARLTHSYLSSCHHSKCFLYLLSIVLHIHLKCVQIVFLVFFNTNQR